ncbi:MAG: hypothetical protein K6G50_01410 [bacterium]|nr:hypothetical protein [bacterium]
MAGEKKKIDADTIELVRYLDEVIADYKRCVNEIGKMKYAAPQLLYYRDEVQDILDALVGSGADLKDRLQDIRLLDMKLRANARDFVREVGHANFKQYQIINNPPITHWWWYMNRTTMADKEHVAPWQWLRNQLMK